MRRFLKHTLLCGALFWLLAAASPPLLAPLQMFEARTIVTGTDLRERPAGLLRCLRDVLMQVSGNPAVAVDPRLPTLAPHPDDLLRDLDYVDRMSGIAHHDEQGSSDRPYYLTARFDPSRIESLLAALGTKRWAEPRPSLLPVILVLGPGTPYPLAGDVAQAAGQREALAAAAERYALPLAIPAHSASPAGAPPPGRRLAITGSLVWSDLAHGWVGGFDGPRPDGGLAHWQVSGVSYDEAFRVLVRGAAALASGHADGLPAAEIASPP